MNQEPITTTWILEPIPLKLTPALMEKIGQVQRNSILLFYLLGGKPGGSEVWW
jgi:hypothetical protein